MSERDPRPDLDTLRTIQEATRAPCATLFVPVDPTRESVSHAGALHMRAARDTLARRLASLGVDEARRAALDAPLEALRDEGPPPHDVRTRALLVQEDAGWRFGLTAEEEPQEPRVVVGCSFALRPLLREARRQAAFRVLAVSARRVALFASRNEGRDLRELERGPLPASLEDALGHDLDQREAGLQAHSTRGHGRAATYHGQGGADDERSADLERFHRVLADALRERLAGAGEPLLLAADRRHQAGLRAAAGELFLAEGIPGNPDERPSHELAAEAHARVARARATRDAEELEGLDKARARGKAVFGLEDTLEAAATGRVRRLFVPALGAHPGRVDASALRPVAPWADEDLADELAGLVLHHGGEVVPWEPGHPPADGVEFAAELR